MAQATAADSNWLNAQLKLSHAFRPAPTMQPRAWCFCCKALPARTQQGLPQQVQTLQLHLLLSF